MGVNASKRSRVSQDLLNQAIVVAPSKTEIEEISAEEFLSLLNYDCWEMILSFIRDPKDVQNLLNLGFPLFDEILDSRRTSILLALAMPILMCDTDKWTRQSLLACRQVDKSVKTAMDKNLDARFKDLFPIEVFVSDPDGFPLQAFVAHAERMTANANPFILNYFDFNNMEFAEELCQLAVRFLGQFGHYLRQVVFTDFPDNYLTQALSHCPNLEGLSIRSGLEPRDQDGNTMELTLPPLPKLKDLSVGMPFEDRLAGYPYRTVAPWIRSMLLAYGPQLKSFNCEPMVFECGITPEVFTSTLTNLEELKLRHFDDADISKLCTILSQIEWLKLKKFRMREFFRREPIFNHTFLEALDNMSKTLEELRLPKFDIKGFGWLKSIFNYNNFETFPNLKLVYARESEAESLIWTFLSVRFVNLEVLRFEADSRGRRYSPPEPSNIRIKWFFKIFPRMRYILWPSDDLLRLPETYEYTKYLRDGKICRIINYDMKKIIHEFQ